MAVDQQVLNRSLLTLASLSESFSLNNALARVPHFTGTHLSLRDFIADVRNAITYVPADLRASRSDWKITGKD